MSKTNREVFMEKLQDSNIETFVYMITSGGKCTRCSNHYWDGNVSKCHQNINNSSCDKGIAEYMEARSGENAQVKYNKKYSTFCSYSHAMLGKELATVLYQAGVVDKLEPPCEWCGPDKDECINCDRFWCNILDMSRIYARELAASFDEFHQYEAHEAERKFYGNTMIFISEVLIPKIKESELRAQAELLVKLINQVYDDKRKEREALKG